MTLLVRYQCDHIGRNNIAPNAKEHTFIRVAEIRSNPVIESDVNCPACKREG